MGTLEAKSIIAGMETPLEEPAGAKQQEEESEDSNTTKTENFVT